MRILLRLLIKYYSFLLFILLEFVCLIAIIQQNNYHNAVFINASSGVIGFTNDVWSNITDYFYLKEENKKLHSENLRLHQMLEEKQASYPALVNDVIKAEIINVSVNRNKNYLSLNKGKTHGIKEDMAVMGPEGVVGVIEETSRHYSSVIPLINTTFYLSASIKRNNYFGSLSWDGNNYRYIFLEDIPLSVDVNVGDTIVTSGYSSSFPKGKLVGTVSSIGKHSSQAFRKIKVKLATDFKSIRKVYIIKQALKDEQIKLESTND